MDIPISPEASAARLSDDLTTSIPFKAFDADTVIA